MPQFDITTFASQIFWLALCLISLCIFMARVSIPRIAAILEQRRHTIASESHKADELKIAALKVQSDYEKIMSDAKLKRTYEVTSALESITALTIKRRKEINDTMATRLKTAEAHVNKYQDQSVDAIKLMAENIAQTLIKKLVKLDVPPVYLSKILSATMEKTGT